MHLNGLDVSADVSWRENNNAARLQDTGLNTTDGYCANTADFVDILQGQTQGLVGGTRWGQDGVEGFNQSLAFSIVFLALNLPSLETWHVGGGFQHVVAVSSGNGYKGNTSWIVTNLLDVREDFLLDFLITRLAACWLR